MKIKSIRIKTFSNEYLKLPNDTALIWERNFNRNKAPCFTMQIPEEIKLEGIAKISIEILPAKAFYGKGGKTILKIFMHKHGLLFSDLPSASPDFNIFQSSDIPVEIEVLELLEYNGEPCNNDENYRLDQCKQEYIYQV